MAALKCGVDNCTHNQENCCCKGDIMVGGTHATNEKDTSCESFREAMDESFKSSMEHPCHTISIDCEAVKCEYNSNYKCHAENVTIQGNGAADSEDTACATFKEK